MGRISTTATARPAPALPRRLAPAPAPARRAPRGRAERTGRRAPRRLPDGASPRGVASSRSSASSDDAGMGGALQRRGVSKDDLAALLEISRPCDTLYLHLTGLARVDDDEIVAVLEDVYECVARVDPSAEVVPLLERCGWDADAVMALEDRIGDEDHLVTLSLELEEGDATGETRGGADAGDETVDKTSVGGTFDRMHAGHRLLLATASAVTRSRDAPTVYVGVTGDVLLRNKRHRDLIEPYEARAAAAASFVAKTRPPTAPLAVKCGPLDDGPPLAATVADMRALVVSRETLAGGEAIQEARKDAGLAPLRVTCVGLVKGRAGKGRGEDGKVSSTALRADAADDRERRRMRGGS